MAHSIAMSPPQGFAPIPECPFGLLVVDDNLPAEEYVAQLHSYGMLLFRGHPSLSREQLVQFMRSRFPEAAPRPAPPVSQDSAQDRADEDVLAYLDRRLVSAMGSIKDEDGNYAIDYVPASEMGAPLQAGPATGWTSELERSLDDWVMRRQECSFQEWHTDGMFGPSPPSCTALYCVQEGNSYTAFADGREGYHMLPQDLRAFADTSDALYRPSIIYGNPQLDVPSLGSRVNQNRASGRQVEAQSAPEAPEINTLNGDTPHPKDPTFAHPLVQPHPWTGEKCLRFSIKALETVGNLPPREGIKMAWTIMRIATAAPNAYLHKWQAGDIIACKIGLTSISICSLRSPMLLFAAARATDPFFDSDSPKHIYLLS
eukprot:COSAG02_NODE_5928_length_3936_cov_9.495960_3_plen_372_part_00